MVFASAVPSATKRHAACCVKRPISIRSSSSNSVLARDELVGVEKCMISEQNPGVVQTEPIVVSLPALKPRLLAKFAPRAVEQTSSPGSAVPGGNFPEHRARPDDGTDAQDYLVGRGRRDDAERGAMFDDVDPMRASIGVAHLIDANVENPSLEKPGVIR